MKSLQLLLIILPTILTAENSSSGFLNLFKTKSESLSKKFNTFSKIENINIPLPNLPEFGKEKNIYSKQDKYQVNKNQELIKQSKIVQQAGLKNETSSSNPAILKAAFAPGPTEFYDYKKEIWYNFRYKSVNLVASGLVYSSDRTPPHCEIYQPALNWTSEILVIFA